MSSRKISMLFMARMVMTVAVGCQQKRSTKKTSLGRNLRGTLDKNFTGDPATSSNLCGGYSISGKYWGEITLANGQSQQDFIQQVSDLTAPSLGNEDNAEGLGTVSGSPGASTGIRFWGDAPLPKGAGALDMSDSEIRIEIHDSNACQKREDGTIRPIIPIHLGPREPGQQSAKGQSYSDGRVLLEWEDSFGIIRLEGRLNGQQFSGTVIYSTERTGDQPTRLGQFSVNRCGFFRCN